MELDVSSAHSQLPFFSFQKADIGGFYLALGVAIPKAALRNLIVYILDMGLRDNLICRIPPIDHEVRV